MNMKMGKIMTENDLSMVTGGTGDASSSAKTFTSLQMYCPICGCSRITEHRVPIDAKTNNVTQKCKACSYTWVCVETLG